MPDEEKRGLGRRIISGSAGLAKKTAHRAAQLARIAKINTEIAAEKDKVRRVQMEIGKIYFENYKDEPQPLLAESCEKIQESLSAIFEKKQLIESLKAGEPVKTGDPDGDIFEE